MTPQERRYALEDLECEGKHHTETFEKLAAGTSPLDESEIRISLIDLHSAVARMAQIIRALVVDVTEHD